MSDLSSHLGMTRDPIRVPARAAAIRAVVRPGDVVLDPGARVETVPEEHEAGWRGSERP